MEQLITISEDSPTTTSIIPENDGTLPYLKYEILISNPYCYTELEFFKEVHHVKRNKPHLKIDSYRLRRMHLPKRFGWGVHINEQKKIAIIPCESAQYQKLLEDESVKKLGAYRNQKREN
ncbi:DUF6157 family protein [Desulforhopalus singaporensis]|uniref:Uncharacterized protein n=1 Tax=Desulforhopalus singaporensis TaxID=91360 RepID=A0A1H0U554_9BACT|nr:DUF6157 family protein [Desulforhopalus singaporensis]SDP61289.1 hypothetical protein SAMN05660330_03380 [Desulforhopalus singaporensis]